MIEISVGKKMMPHQMLPRARIIRQSIPFQVDGMAIPYPEFVPRLYNFCKSLGFRKGLILPSRAFCSDENQGLPIILLTKHFGTFPFNHGRVGGIVAVDRHGPHAQHGEDSVIVQASHVGYDPDTGTYGSYRRSRRVQVTDSSSCGKIAHVIAPYLEQYHFARERIFLVRDDAGRCCINVKNSFVDFAVHRVRDGIVLRLEEIAVTDDSGVIRPLSAHSTSQTYEVNASFRKQLEQKGYHWQGGQGEKIGELLSPELFFFREDLHETDEAILLERNLIEFMPQIVTSKNPQLRAAKINVQMEFARVVESIRRGDEYRGKNLFYIAGLNIDIPAYRSFPPTNYFVPWAAHVQLRSGGSPDYIHPLEQQELFNRLMEQSTVNDDQVNLREEIGRMLEAPRFDIRSPH